MLCCPRLKILYHFWRKSNHFHFAMGPAWINKGRKKLRFQRATIQPMMSLPKKWNTKTYSRIFQQCYSQQPQSGNSLGVNGLMMGQENVVQGIPCNYCFWHHILHLTVCVSPTYLLWIQMSWLLLSFTLSPSFVCGWFPTSNVCLSLLVSFSIS